jgi:hypothetical protein
MIQPTRGKTETGVNIFWFEIWEFLEYLLCRQTRSKKLKHIRHANSHASNAGTPGALFRVYRDAFKKVRHECHSNLNCGLGVSFGFIWLQYLTWRLNNLLLNFFRMSRIRPD